MYSVFGNSSVSLTMFVCKCGLFALVVLLINTNNVCTCVGKLIANIPKDGVGSILISKDDMEKPELLNKDRLMIRFDLQCLDENGSKQQVMFCVRIVFVFLHFGCCLCLSFQPPL